MIYPSNLKPITGSSVRLTLADASNSLSDFSTIPVTAIAARIQFLTTGVAYTETTEIAYARTDATDVSSDNGMLFGHKDFIELRSKAEINGFRFITAEAGKNGKIQVDYFSK